MLKWRLEKIHLDLKFDWNISRQSSQFKTNFIVHVSDGTYSAMGEVAPNLRYGETVELIQAQFDLLADGLIRIQNENDILDLCKTHKIKNALSFGLESAFIHLKCKQTNQTVIKYFNLPEPKRVFTSFSLPIMPDNQIESFLKSIPQFKSYKIKVNRTNAEQAIKAVRKVTNKPLRIDANESFTDANEFRSFINNLDDPKIDFIEQPMPASMINDYKKIKENCKYSLIADESIEAEADFDSISAQFHGINIKLMKAGSYTNAIGLLKKARQLNLKTMIGCMIETGLGISSAYNLCGFADYVDLDGFLILKNDPFPLLIEIDGELMLNH